MASTTLTKAELRKLKKRLPANYTGAVLESMGSKFTPEYITMVLNGRRNNDEVLEHLIRCAEAQEEKVARLRERAVGKPERAAA